MTKEQKIILLEKKAADLVAWFEGKQLPAAPFKIKTWATVTDTKKYFETATERMRAHKGNPYHTLYVNSYHQLNDLKMFMENGKESVQ